jgi:hypothetical protein
MREWRDFMKTKKMLRGPHGGPRPNSGRKPKPDKASRLQVTCVLQRDTVERLRNSATPPGKAQTKYFGEYLQWHLNFYPPVSYEVWQAELALPKRPKPTPLKQIKLTKAAERAERVAIKELREAVLGKR